MPAHSIGYTHSVISPHRPWLSLLLAVVVLLSCSYSPWSQAAERPRIGLVLSGGGARGLAHIGVLQTLEELQIPIDAIAATSMGAIIGGLYASGMPLSDMQQQVQAIDWTQLFNDSPSRSALDFRRKQEQNRYLAASPGLGDDGKIKLPRGAVGGTQLELLLSKLSQRSDGIYQFDQLPIPYRAIATDLESGQMLVFQHGSLATAMRASMSVPGAMAPVEYQQRLLVDGGLVRNLPVDIARQMGVDVVIAVNLGTPLFSRDQLNDVVGITAQMIAILTEQNVQRSLGELSHKDILIAPELGDISAADFQRSNEAIAQGALATQHVAKQLRRYALKPADYQRWQQQRQRDLPASPVIDRVEVNGLKRIPAPVVSRPLENHLGQALDLDSLASDLSYLYGRGDFEHFSYQLRQQDGQNVLDVQAREKSWGPNYLQFGLGASTDFDSDTEILARAMYRRTWVNDWGAEWRSQLDAGTSFAFSSEFYQPLGLDSPWFIAPYVDYANRNTTFYNGDHSVAEYALAQTRLGVDLGLSFERIGEWRLGLAWRDVSAELDVGPDILPDFAQSTGVIRSRLLLDTLDDFSVPRQGYALRLEALAALEALGADDSYSRLEGEWRGAYTLGADTISAGVRLGITPDAERLPPHDQFTLGGFAQLSGYHNEQLRGQQVALGRLMYYHRLGLSAPPLLDDLYFGATLESGGVWRELDEVDTDGLQAASSLFFGANTALGPMYLAVGLAEGGQSALYLYLGRP